MQRGTAHAEYLGDLGPGVLLAGEQLRRCACLLLRQRWTAATEPAGLTSSSQPGPDALGEEVRFELSEGTKHMEDRYRIDRVVSRSLAEFCVLLDVPLGVGVIALTG